MLNQLDTAGDLAADHHRTLRAEAEAYRLARTARRSALLSGAPAGRDRARRFGWPQLLRLRRRRGQPAGRAPA